MKKHVALFLVFTLLCGLLSACGAVAPTDEPTASPTEISEATATSPAAETPTESPEATFDYVPEPTSDYVPETPFVPTPVPEPTETPFSWPVQEETWDVPEAYRQENLPSYMTTVDIIAELYRLGYSVEISYPLAQGTTGNDYEQIISVNAVKKGDQLRYGVVVFDYLNKKVVREYKGEYGEEILTLPDGFKTYTKDEMEQYYADLDSLFEDFDGEEMTTIAQETKGILSGGIYDKEYKRYAYYVHCS